MSMISKSVIALFLAALALLAGGGALAAEESYQARVPVPNQSAEARTEALKIALSEVLQRATGRAAVSEAPALAALLEEPGRFLQLYRYETVPAQPGQAAQLMLSARFDGAGLRRALAERGVPVWAPDRPPVLVWLGVERGGERFLVGGDEAAGLRDELLEAARARGVPLLFPLLDAEDLGKVSLSDIWGGFDESVRAASRRYGTPLVLIGRLRPEFGGDWAVRWRLYQGDEAQAWTGSAAELGAVLDAGVAALAGNLLADYASLPGGSFSEALVLRVEGLASLADYVAVERYLRELSGVKALHPRVLEGREAVFQLELTADPGRVLRALDAGQTLASVPADANAGELAERRYRLLQ